ncbi:MULTISPECIES: hypothetical protein [unclassified Flavobacterium]|uniref:hypothetical protein n=1 Tax=unclassified Flavobacterium TaxID=196869 RepID=UPI00086D0E81|nr:MULTISPECIES: hypothetical protein [unclassified Flavobacterium]MBN9284124.1 hypothetical protein [Flavobacterium sp.]ODS83592.1 MAG: hypothetical protein ABS44_17205 [Chryseobacterium sp. SCN 40-13]OJV71138.1 MAG: hypothetical protein BGO42_04820 [Flavobacterium sp. 40-81]
MERLLEDIKSAFDEIENRLITNGYNVSNFVIDMQDEDSLRNGFDFFLEDKYFDYGLEHVLSFKTIIHKNEKTKELIKAEFLIYYKEELRKFTLIEVNISLTANKEQFNKTLTTPDVYLPACSQAIKIARAERRYQQKKNKFKGYERTGYNSIYESVVRHRAKSTDME